MNSDVRTVAVRRHEFRSTRPFDEVLAAVHAGLGRPDFAALQRRLDAAADWNAFQQVGAFAPVTILLFERPDGVPLRYDTVVSCVGDELDDAAREHAGRPDESVLTLLAGAV